MGRQEQELREEQLDRVLDMNKEIRRLRSIISVRDEALAMIGSRAMSGTATPTAIAQMCGDAAAGYDIVDMECWRGAQDSEGAGGIPPMDDYRV